MKLNLAVTAILLSSSPLTYSQGVDRLGRPNWQTTPKAGEPSEATDPAVESARAKYFNVPEKWAAKYPDVTKPTNPPSETGEYEDYSTPEPLPTSNDTLVTGVVVKQSPYVSADYTHIYSELIFQPETIVKDASKAMSSGKNAVILSKGGSLKLANGQVIAAVAPGGSNPINLNKKYLLFLHYIPDAHAYVVRKAWDISNTHPQELDGDGRPFKRITSDTNLTTTPDALLSLVQSRVNSKSLSSGKSR